MSDDRTIAETLRFAPDGDQLLFTDASGDEFAPTTDTSTSGWVAYETWPKQFRLEQDADAVNLVADYTVWRDSLESSATQWDFAEAWPTKWSEPSQEADAITEDMVFWDW